jgi:beta-lactamase regulating signal transducer with metallopeptidase domain
MNAFVTALGTYAADVAVLSTVFLLFALAVMAVLRRPCDQVCWGWATMFGLALVTTAPALPSWPRLEAAAWLLQGSTNGASADAGDSAALALAARALIENVESAHDPTFASKPGELLPAEAVFGAQDMASLEAAAMDDERLAVETTAGVRPGATAPSGSLSWRRIAVATWFVVVVLSAGWIVLGAFQARQLVRRAEPAPDWILREMERLAGGDRAPSVAVAAAIPTPMVLGVVRPVVLLPASSLAEGQRAAVRAALAHEWAHVHHGDLWLLALARLLFPIFSAQPLFWLLCRKVRFAQEVCADAAAAGESPVPYAEAVLAWAKAAAPARAAGGWLRMAMWECPNNLTRRIEMILHAKSGLKSSGRLPRLCAVVLAATASVGLSLVTFRPAAEAQDAKAELPKATTPANVPTLPDPRAASATEPAAKAAPRLEGVVLAVSEDGQLVEISLGADDGLAKGTTLEVFRQGDKPQSATYLGRIRVIETQADEAVAEVIPERRQGKIEPKDNVAANPEQDKPAGRPAASELPAAPRASEAPKRPRVTPPSNAPAAVPADGESVVKVLPLKHHNADELAKLLGKVLAERESDRQLRIVADTRTNSLLVQGRAQDVEFVEALVAVLQDLAAAAEKPQAAAAAPMRAEPAYPAARPRPMESKPLTNLARPASGSRAGTTTPAAPGAATGQTVTERGKPASEVEISLLELDVAEARLDLEAATERYEQAKDLSATNTISQGELKQRLYDMEKAKIRLKRIEIMLSAAKEGKTVPNRNTVR